MDQDSNDTLSTILTGRRHWYVRTKRSSVQEASGADITVKDFKVNFRLGTADQCWQQITLLVHSALLVP